MKEEEDTVVNMKIVKGKPIVNHAYSCYVNNEVALICVDMESKHAKISAIGGGEHPCILLEANKDTYPINHKYKKNHELTQIYFIDFNHNWNIFCSEVHKYTIFITLRKGIEV